MNLTIDGNEVLVSEDLQITCNGIKYMFPNAGNEIYNLAQLYHEYYGKSLDYYLIKHTMDYYIKYKPIIDEENPIV